MDVLRRLGTLMAREVPDQTILAPVHLERPDAVRVLKLVQQWLDRVGRGGPQAHLQSRGLPLEDALVIRIGPQRDPEDLGRIAEINEDFIREEGGVDRTDARHQSLPELDVSWA